jgi:import inner membrane translocase subunit TIM16
MNQFKEQMGSMIKTPMTREEALQILNIEVKEEIPEDSEKVMERFETLFEKNLPEKGGSFYIQSKVYFAKEFLM